MVLPTVLPVFAAGFPSLCPGWLFEALDFEALDFEALDLEALDLEELEAIAGLFSAFLRLLRLGSNGKRLRDFPALSLSNSA